MGIDIGKELHNLILMGVGAVAMSAEKSQDIMESLVKKGALTMEQGKVLNEELKHTAQRVRDEQKTAAAAQSAQPDAADKRTAPEPKTGSIPDTDSLTDAQKRELLEKLQAQLGGTDGTK